MPEQSTAAAERSAHVLRDRAEEDRCYICGGPWKKGGASYASRIIPPLVQVCSAECAAASAFADPKRERILITEMKVMVESISSARDNPEHQAGVRWAQARMLHYLEEMESRL